MCPHGNTAAIITAMYNHATGNKRVFFINVICALSFPDTEGKLNAGAAQSVARRRQISVKDRKYDLILRNLKTVKEENLG